MSGQIYSTYRQGSLTFVRRECTACDGVGTGDGPLGDCLYCDNGVVTELEPDEDDEQ